MSKFNEISYIESTLAELSSENKAKLLHHVNGKSADGSADITYQLKTLSEMAIAEAGVYPIIYQYSSTIAWKGFLIRTTSHIAFVTFKNSIDVKEAEVFKVESGLVSKGFITADYLRTILREDSYVDATELVASQPWVGSEEAYVALGSPHDEDKTFMCWED